MMKKILVSVLCFISVLVPTVAVYTPTYAMVNCNDTPMGFRSWYYGLPNAGADCMPTNLKDSDGSTLSKFIWTIVLNVLHDLSIAIMYGAIGFIMYGGFKYVTAAGSADKVASGKKTITNAVTGLIVGIAAAAIVNTIYFVLM
jgi:hypothetical protein